ncbi:Cadherin EGF LAG seven-pass G-type receptor 1 [Holothuria leucospilota]|uniref:Cadherin EGF LAG seven-pass G-type receptor 1 n=1 Tax=Holothuria leucospilota TaxID=206669 RepID=A0A9Q1BTD2_HOLLE|nr:Cadherin EGF LAG seven-pass G-type receptor 1 [Holothuria leucospilota]
MGYKYACRVRPCTSLDRDEWNESGCSKESNTSIRLNINCSGTEENVSQCLKLTNVATFLINEGASADGVMVTCAVFNNGNCLSEISYNDEKVALCGSDHSCRNRCWSWSGTVDCKCDLACKEFVDCCYDFDIHCGSKMMEKSNDTLAFPDTVSGADYSCFGTEYFYSMSYMVTKCVGSRESVTDVTFELCENMPTSDDILSHLPVFDSNGVVYKNVFCAECSGVRYSDVTAWYLKVSKALAERVPSNETNGTSLLALGSLLFTHRRSVIQPPDPGEIGHPRWCTTYKEPTCKDPPDASSSLFAPLSEQFEYAWSTVDYYNPLAYICDIQKLTFTWDVCTTSPYVCRDFFSKYDRCFQLSGNRGGEPPHLTLLFDFSNTDSLAMEVAGELCTKAGEIFDVFLGRCRFLACPVSYKIHNNICEDHQTTAVRACIMDIPKGQWLDDSVHLSKSTEDMYSAFLSARGILSALLMKLAMQKKLLQDTVTFRHNVICNVTLFIVGIKSVEEPECYEPNPLLQPFNISVTGVPFFVYQFQSAHTGIYQETFVAENCWKRYSGDLQCDPTNLKPIDFEIIDDSTVLDKDSGVLFTIDAIKVNMDGTIEVCLDDFSLILNKIVSVLRTLCFIISFCLLFSSFVINIAFSNLRTLIRICVLNIIFSLLVINIVIYINGYLPPFVCMIASVISHFAWMYMFTWATNVFSIVVQSWHNRKRLFHMQDKKSKYLAIYCVTSWGFSGVVTIVSVVIFYLNNIDDLTSRYGVLQFCWISVGNVTKFALWIPVGFLLLLDAIFFIVVKFDSFKRHKPNNHRATGRVSPPDYRASVILFVSVHGIALLGFLHFLLRHALLELVFLLAFCMQSIFIFGAFVPIKKLVNMLQLYVRNYFLRCLEDSLENRARTSHDKVRAKSNTYREDQPQMMKRLDNTGN